MPSNEKFNELLMMKSSRKRPTSGDTFVIQPMEGRYFFGRVVLTNIESKHPFFKGWNLLYIYNKSSIKKEVPPDLTQSELIIPPVIINNQGWAKVILKQSVPYLLPKKTYLWTLDFGMKPLKNTMMFTGMNWR
ncbi:Imm26 family immunity protein [Paenibacillus sp. NPDC056579]|uniref:Imm26 family immunity protein n=1 Tax=Paenibacillus sp. NPDC056579 TaxID=3345871 RepID=UPI0036BAC6C4